MSPLKFSFWKAATARSVVSENLNNFTPRAQQVLALAGMEARRLNHSFVGTEHLLLGLIKLGQGTGVGVLTRMGVHLDTVRLDIEKQIGPGPEGTVSSAIPYTPRVRHVLSLAATEAMQLNHTYVGTEHILLGLLKEGEGVAGRVLKAIDVNVGETRKEILRVLEAGHPFLLSSAGPKVAIQAEAAEMAKSEMDVSVPTPVDLSKRYDLYCTEAGQEILYRSVLFKGPRILFQSEEQDNGSDFIEIEQADGQTFFVSKSAIVKFCEHRSPPSPPPQANCQNP